MILAGIYWAAGSALGLQVASRNASRRGQHRLSLGYGIAGIIAAVVGLVLIGIGFASRGGSA